MPTAKGFLDNVKTASYRMNSIQSIRRSKKSHSSFKITVAQDGPGKTYEFEAENEATAGTSLHARPSTLLTSWQRSSFRELKR